MSHPKPDWKRIAGEDTYLSRYLAACDGMETAIAYDFMGGLWVLSSVVGRNIVIPRPASHVWLNLFVILSAESGITRKSTAVRFATKMLHATCNKSVNIIQDKLSPGALQHRMAQSSRRIKRAHVALSFSELAAALGRGAGISGMPALLTDMYDCPDLHEGGGTKGEIYNIRNVYLTFLSASTPSWLRRAVNPDIIEGGFTSRCMFVRSEKPKRLIAWGCNMTQSERRVLTEQVETDLMQARRSTVLHLDLTESAHGIFSKWYLARRSHSDPFRASFASREADHVLKIAGLLAISRDRRSPNITAHDVQNAIVIVTWIREDAAMLFDKDDEHAIARPKELDGIDKLRDLLINAGTLGLPQSAISKRLARYLSGVQITDVLAVMHELQMVQRFEVKAVHGRPTTVWRGTKLILDRDANSLLLHRAAAGAYGPSTESTSRVEFTNGDEFPSE